jgi:GDP-4-dehydro-6-deoxy-D-mannose reductase
MKVLILGANGFTGRELIRHLERSAAHEIYCAALSLPESPRSFECDLTCAESVLSLVTTTRPAQVYHLAGRFTNDYEVDYAANVVSTKNLLDGIRKLQIDCRVLLVGSSAEYGLVEPTENPVEEEHDLNPISVYGLTKVFQTQLMRLYHTVHRMDVVLARPFNLLGRGVSPRLFVGRVQQQIESYLKGEISRIVLGNLRHRRDYISVEKAVAAYELIMNHGQAGEVYNVGSGHSIAIRELLKNMLAEHGLSMDIVDEQLNDDSGRPDIKDLYADLSKISRLEKKAPGAG